MGHSFVISIRISLKLKMAQIEIGQWLNYTFMGLGGKYDFIMTELRDKRVDTWLLMSSPWPTLGLCVLYYYLVRFAGPAFMKGRPAYDVQKLMFLYNFLQTLFSAWIFSRLSRFWLSGKYSWVCQPVDY